MQRIAAEVNYSETAFLPPRADEPNVYDVRYFAPLQEVPFCGHATIASAVALAEREPAAEMIFHTPAGLVTHQHRARPARAGRRADQRRAAGGRRRPTAWCRALPGRRCAGRPMISTRTTRRCWPTPAPSTWSWSPATHERLADLDYDFDALAAIMRRARADHACS